MADNDNQNNEIGYAGDILPMEAWQILKSDGAARLIDVRTSAEWAFVGMSDLSSLNKEVMFLEWQMFPNLARNDAFVDQLVDELAKTGAGKDTALLFVCRSGQRSRSAAMAMTKQGFSKCFNFAQGFEGDLDQQRQRGKIGGWKAAGLPWVQQ